MRWYITVAAVLEWQRLQGRPEERDGAGFDLAERELADLCEAATLKRAIGDTSGSRDAAQYQAWTRIRGRRTRIELYVTEQPRTEGPLAQLVRVRRKGGEH